MWVLKFKLVDKNCIWATRCKKFNVHDYQYPLSFYKTEGGLALVMYHILGGENAAKKKFISDVKKDERIKRLEIKKDFVISLAVEKRPKAGLKAFPVLYSPRLIYIKPGINCPDGSEVWEVGSFDKKDLVKLFDACKKEYFGELFYLKQLKIPKLFIAQIMPELTEKQQEAFRIASENDYYEFPRKTNLIELSKKTGVSRPTYEEHLRKAENKLLKFMKELIPR